MWLCLTRTGNYMYSTAQTFLKSKLPPSGWARDLAPLLGWDLVDSFSLLAVSQLLRTGKRLFFVDVVALVVTLSSSTVSQLLRTEKRLFVVKVVPSTSQEGRASVNLRSSVLFLRQGAKKYLFAPCLRKSTPDRWLIVCHRAAGLKHRSLVRSGQGNRKNIFLPMKLTIFTIS